MKYNHKKIESKWQKYWEKEKLNFADDKDNKKPKFYCLDMFPYPSGDGLHVGHPEGYTATDIYCRFMRMNGYNVLHPMGWDAFGLPAENYAIKKGVHPKESTTKNIKRFKSQIKSLGFSYDWEREINTSDPSYYKWTQWLFLELYNKGLAYQKKAPVNWCENCKTVLAREQVIDGKCERCGKQVIQKELKQWFFKITDYAEELLGDLQKLDWPDKIKKMQENWIGRSEGAEIDFKVTENSATTYVLLHGYKGSPEKNFFPWLKSELEKNGSKVYVPNLPDSDDPKVIAQVQSVLKHIPFDNNTVIIGHSLGTVVALKILEKLKIPVKKTILIGGFTENRFFDDKFPEHTFDWKFNFNKIKTNAGNVVIIRDLKDSSVPQDNTYSLYNKIGGEIVDVDANKPHFTDKIEPKLLNSIFELIRIFTTRPDTIFGATYLVLAPEHELVTKLKSKIENLNNIEDYINKTQSKTELERTSLEKVKTGIELKGINAINPANKKEIPIYIADYVLTTYGTGAIMAVPAHDERDFEFANKYKLPISEVISSDKINAKCYPGKGKMINSEKFDGMESEKAKDEIIKFVGGKKSIQYRLKDWLISRQRYWGAPVPIIYCDKCGIVAVPEKDLPVELPDDVDFKPTGESPLTRSSKFHNVKCPKCQSPARRESDTMDTFVDSSWYFIRYTDPNNKLHIANSQKLKKWLPVDLYIGGAEHAVMHLLYARFITKVLRDLKYLEYSEPFSKLRNQGLILSEDGRKMSKSLGNVINPDEIVNKFGADALRMYEMFLGPLEDAKPWDTKGIIGIRRFLDRVWNTTEKVKSKNEKVKTNANNSNLLNLTIKKVSDDIKYLKFNTAISSMMIFMNELGSNIEISAEDFDKFIIILSPFAPHIAEELWHNIGHKESIFQEKWPKCIEVKIYNIKVAVQVNGKFRGIINIHPEISEKEILAFAKKDLNVMKYLKGKTIKKTIYIPGKILSIVI